MNRVRFIANVVLGLFLIIIGVNLLDIGLDHIGYYDETGDQYEGMFGVLLEGIVDVIIMALFVVFVSIVVVLVIINLKMK